MCIVKIYALDYFVQSEYGVRFLHIFGDSFVFLFFGTQAGKAK